MAGIDLGPRRDCGLPDASGALLYVYNSLSASYYTFQRTKRPANTLRWGRGQCMSANLFESYFLRGGEPLELIPHDIDHNIRILIRTVLGRL